MQHLLIAHCPAYSSKPLTPRKPLQKAEAGQAHPTNPQASKHQALQLAASSWCSQSLEHPMSLQPPLWAAQRWCSLLTYSYSRVSPCHPDPIQSLCLMNSWQFINRRYPCVIKAILQCWMGCKEKQNWMLSSKRCLATDYKKSLRCIKENLQAQKWGLADWGSCPCFVLGNLYVFAEQANSLILRSGRPFSIDAENIISIRANQWIEGFIREQISIPKFSMPTSQTPERHLDMGKWETKPHQHLAHRGHQ